MLLPAAALLVGLISLAWGADRFVFGAAATARNLGVSPLVVGLTVVGFGTSAPELMISAFAAWQGNPELAIGNALGSNVANIGLVLGVTAVVTPLAIRSDILKREYPVMFGVMLLTLALMGNGTLSRMDGVILLGALAVLIGWTVQMGMRQRAANRTARQTDPLTAEYEQELARTVPAAVALGWLAVGLVFLLASSRLLVWGAIELATHFGVSDLVIGLTVVAVGTSLPEVATSVASSLKGEHDIALGNVLGSNMFNILGVVGVSAVLHPYDFSPEVLSRDYPVMLLMTVALVLLAFRRRGPARIERFQGALLLAGYAAYILILAQGLSAG